MTKQELETLFNHYISKYPELSGWKLAFHNKKNSLATCNYIRKEILFSIHYVEIMTKHGVEMTIIHELAHALTPKDIAHGKVWRRKCIEMGGNGERVAQDNYYIGGFDAFLEYKASISKYYLICPECGNKIPINRMPKVEASCSRHGDKKYNPARKLILIEN